MNSKLDVTDCFCGAGGSSQGAADAGAEIHLALNHWKLAIETHNTNFPNAKHDCSDISATDPRRYPSTTIFIGSPECTNHSLAKGKKIVRAQMSLYENGILDPAAERSRATMWDVPRFAEVHKYKIMVIENVVDARKWVMWEAWLHAMHCLGYEHETVYRNSMHSHPTPQSRDRMYVVFWKKGQRKPNLDFTAAAYCVKCNKDVESVQTWKKSKIRFGKYRQQYVYCCPSCARIVEPYYYAAFNCIDWSNIGTRIGDRKKELSHNTTRRIQYGLDKYGNLPFVLATRYTSGIDCRVKAINEAIGTQVADVSHGIAMPFITMNEHTKVDPQVRPVSEPIQTQATRQTMALVMPPFIVENKKTSNARSITDRLGAVTTVPYLGIVTHESFNSFISYYYGTSQASHITQAFYSARTKDSYQLISYAGEPKIEDCFYRMLTSSEIGRAMAFGAHYKVLGTEKDKVKQYGNAVTPPVMRDIIERCIESLN